MSISCEHKACQTQQTHKFLNELVKMFRHDYYFAIWVYIEIQIYLKITFN